MRIHAAALTVVLGGLLATSASAASPFATIDAFHGELPKNVVPTSYVIDVAPDPKTMKIAGHETIAIVVRHATSTIVLNELQTTFGKVTLDGTPATVSVNEKKQQAAFSFASPVAAGKHKLDITYTATLQSSAQGLFKQAYADMNGKPTFMYGSQLEATDARHLFPSWDEPAYRATFQMSFVVPKDWTAVSNTPVTSTTPVGSDRKRVSFAPTPPMQSYLVVLCAGDFEKISTVSDGIKLSVYVTRGKLPEAAYALSVMKDLMPYYDQYYGVRFPISKLDTIAIPGGFPGAMENWGGITYDESTMLFDPAVQPESAKHDAFSIIAHEESHQWNGDLTSFGWWDDVWIAEGFATWMQTKAPDHFHPEWNMYIQADNDADGAMGTDAQITAHPIYTPILNETQAAAIFDSDSYTKAGTLFRMLEQYVGPDKFQAAIQHYFRTNSYTSFNAKTLWADIGAASNTDIAAITHNWIYQPGFPLVTATATCTNGKRSIALTQARYLNDPSIPTGSTVWSIPLNLDTTGTGTATTAVLFNKPTATIDGGSCDAPFVVNGNDVGFYRTQYDDATRAQQQAAFLKLPTADRLSLLEDTQSFAATGHSKIDEYIGYAKADAGDTNPFVVSAVLGEYGSMLTFEKGKPGEAAAKQFVISQVKPMLPIFGGWDGTGMNDDQLHTRNTIITLLARSDDADTIAEAKVRFAKLVADPKAFTPLNKLPVIFTAGYAADPTIYKQLMGMAMSATNPQDQQNDFGAVFSAKDDALAQQNLQLTLHLPPQFAPFAPFIVGMVGTQHPQESWKFLNDNYTKLFSAQTQFESGLMGTQAGQSFATLIPADQIAAYFKAHMSADAAPQVKQAMDNINTQQAVEDRLLPQIDAYIASQASPTSAPKH